MNIKKSNTINYTGDPTLTPESNIIYYGEYNPPDSLNPIFSNAVFDFEVLDNIFTYTWHKPVQHDGPGSTATTHQKV